MIGKKEIPNKTIQQLIKKWIDIELPNCPQFIIDGIGKDTVIANITKEVELNVSHCFESELAQKIIDYCQVKGATVEDCKSRQLKTPLGEIITGIRFVGGDLNKPAVFIIHKDFELKNLNNIKLIGEFLAKEYAIFKPKRIRWYSSTIEKELIANNNFIAGDLIYVAEFIEKLKQQPLPKNFDKVKLVEATTINWHKEYTAAFEKICQQWPGFAEMAQAEDVETLQDLMKKHLLFEIIVDGQFAGIIAADNGTNSFLSGYYIVEELLLEKYRGKHLASAVQRHLIEKLASNNNEMLFGTIHYNNQPSLRTATKLSRKAIGMYVFADI